MLEFFFYELPTTAIDSEGVRVPEEIILSGQRTRVISENVYPFDLKTEYELDARSQNLIGETHVTIANVEILHEGETSVPIEAPTIQPPPIPEGEDTDTEGEPLQFQLDFEAPSEPRTPAPEQHDLTLEMSKGKNLHKPLEKWRKDNDVEYAKFTPEGVYKCDNEGEHSDIWDADSEQLVPMPPFEYPKGVGIKGKAETIIKLQRLTRLIGTAYKGIEGEKAVGDNYAHLTRKVIKPLGNEYVHIRLNGKCEFKMRNFVATVPTETTE